jgi:uncharacterized protein YuzE
MAQVRSRILVKHDPVADAIWIKLREGEYAETRELDSRRLLDMSGDGAVLSIELLDVSDGVDIAGLPAADDLAAALEARGVKVFNSGSA